MKDNMTTVTLLGPPRDNVRNKAAVFITGQCANLMFVSNENDFDKYMSSLNAIKQSIASLNGAHRCGKISDVEYRVRLVKEWLDGCVSGFIDEYGMDSVPNDVRMAITDVKSNLGLPIDTPWPALKYETLDLTMATLLVRTSF